MVRRKDRPEQRSDQADTVEIMPTAVAAAAVVLAADERAILIVEDDHRAETIARIATGFAPDTCVLHLPASDALPGDSAPPSPANVGQRVEALRRLREAVSAADGAILLVLSAEASAVRYAAPEAFDEQPPLLTVGDTLDVEALSERAAAIGYTIDDRVDEPGEIAVRGNVIDVFPVDSATPVRIAFADGRIVTIRAFDPVTQRSSNDLERIVLGRADEPVAQGATIVGHLPDAVVYCEPRVQKRRQRFVALSLENSARGTADLLVDAGAWAAATGDRTIVLQHIQTRDVPRFIERRDPVRALRTFLKNRSNDAPVAIAGSDRDLRFLKPRIGVATRDVASLSDVTDGTGKAIALLPVPIDRGFALDDVTVIAAADLLGSRALVDDTPASPLSAFEGNGELHVGDVVVHEDHGIGVVAGIEPLSTGGIERAAIVLKYAKGARRLVPVEEANRIWRYGADADAVTLDALDGSSWTKRRIGIDAAIADSARALQRLAAERDGKTTDPIEADTAAYERFADRFPFVETHDQVRAIAAVAHDLASGRPMDRLIVGDVGYGKTEVALRAAAIVALAGRQVAIVAPTTVLARQHLDTFTRRFAGTALRVAGLSRTTPPAERKRVRAGLADGSIAVVVGTSAVAGRGVAYRDLALVVIDEEQRFGTKTKHQLRGLGAGHVLTLSATPIPRTLQSAMVGLQAISVIASPPARRQPIRTTVGTFDDTVVRKALMRERARGGQSFVVVPRIENIDGLATKLGALVPDLAVVIAHGDLDAAALDDAMAGFAGSAADILLATNIIEAGLDVPRANTMIVHHADRFGLSQLHQLRGRIGRGGRRGQIMLLTDETASIADATMKRLRTLQAFDRLGAGFAISARDLDMRGAGDLIGEEQAGHLKLIGTALYQYLLGRALRAAQGKDADTWEPEVNLGIPGYLPEPWIPEVDVRLTLYARLARMSDIGEIDGFEAELEDRFGPLPDPASALLDNARIGAMALAAGVREVDTGPAALALTMDDPTATLPDPFERAERRWLVRERIDDPRDRAERVRELLDELVE